MFFLFLNSKGSEVRVSMNTRDSVDGAKTQQFDKLGNRELLMPDLPGSWPEVLSLEDLPNS